MTYIGNQPAESFTSFATQEVSTSATTSYTLDHAVTNENEIALFINNVRQQPGSGKAYTATGTALTLSEATASTDTMYCVFLGRALQTVTPATNSITAAMVGNDLISGKTALASEPADTDEFLVSDAGTLKRIDYSLIKGTGTTTLIKTIDASTASTVEFIDGTSGVTLDSTFDTYLVRGSGIIVSATAGVVMRLRESGSFISSSDYDTVSYVARGTESSLGVDGSTSSSYIRGNWQRYSTTTAGFSINFEARLYNFSSTSLFKQVYYSGCNNGNDANDFSLSHGAGLLDRSSSRTAACDGIQFLATSGTLTGKFSLYGVTT